MKIAPNIFRKPLVAMTTGLLLIVSGCSAADSDSADGIVARVNGQEITTRQIFHLLGSNSERLRGIELRTAAAAALEHLIDEELLVQHALKMELDTDPLVVLDIEAQRRQMLAANYLRRTLPETPDEDRAEVRKFFDEHPSLFSERRIYQMHEIFVEGPEALRARVRAAAANATSMEQMTRWLSAERVPYKETAATWPAEVLAPQLLGTLVDMNDAEIATVALPDSFLVVQLIGTRAAAISEEDARPHIEKMLRDRWRNEHVLDEIARLRQAALIDYPAPLRPELTAPGPDAADSDGTTTGNAEAASGVDRTGVAADHTH